MTVELNIGLHSEILEGTITQYDLNVEGLHSRSANYHYKTVERADRHLTMSAADRRAKEVRTYLEKTYLDKINSHPLNGTRGAVLQPLALNSTLEGFGEVQEACCTRSVRQDDTGYFDRTRGARARMAIL